MARTPEETRLAKREFMVRKRAANPDAARAYQRAVYDRNREVRKARMRAYYADHFF